MKQHHKPAIYLEIISLIILTGTIIGTLFTYSFHFVNPLITPKWFIMIGGILSLGCCYIMKIILTINIPKVDNKLLERSIITIIVGAITLQGIYGILQYYHFLPSNTKFLVTGSFDNPAGFAACLSAGLPVSYYFIFNNKKAIAILAIFIIIIAIILSNSRTGIISSLTTIMSIVIYKFKISNLKSIKLVTLLLIIIIGLYYWKKDSADGRLLIWKCTWSMIIEKPIIGHGINGFKSNYMNSQASYFEKCPNSQYTMLADNINHPFNEYLLLLSNYGFSGLILLLVLISFILKSFKRCKHDLLAYISILCLLSISIFSFFSYPLRYPFVWVILISSILYIIYQAKYSITRYAIIQKSLIFFMTPIIITIGISTYRQIVAERVWYKIATESLKGKILKTLPYYEQLIHSLSKNEYFLYNYAVELNIAEQYKKSLFIAQQCERLWADYYLQLLIADNYQKIHLYKKAEEHYQKASAMCPVKFMPLYKLFKLYKETNELNKMEQIARIIKDKPIKVHSSTIENIKYEVKQIKDSL